MLLQKSVEEFIDETASASPTPGGGSVSALAGALGAALASMVGELTLKKDDDREARLNMQGKVRICRDLMDSLKKGVEEDTEAFNRVMEAYRMPKTTDNEKSIRSGAIQEALIGAAEAPYETALYCIDVMNMSLDMLKFGNKNASSDAAVAGFLGYAGLNGAIYNIKLNLNSIKDSEYVNSMRLRVEQLSDEGEMLLSKIKSQSAEMI